MSAALVEIARANQTSDPLLGAIFLARSINEQVGGALVAPWEVAQLPGDWLDAFSLLRTDLTRMRQNLREFDQYVASWRRKAMNQRH